MKKCDAIGLDDDFVYVSFDVNGLKIVNDSLGHLAGDEVIIAAADCISKTFGKVGTVYRVGGDEFVALVVVNTDKLIVIREEFDKYECKNDYYNSHETKRRTEIC